MQQHDAFLYSMACFISSTSCHDVVNCHCVRKNIYPHVSTIRPDAAPRTTDSRSWGRRVGLVRLQKVGTIFTVEASRTGRRAMKAISRTHLRDARQQTVGILGEPTGTQDCGRRSDIAMSPHVRLISHLVISNSRDHSPVPRPRPCEDRHRHQMLLLEPTRS